MSDAQVPATTPATAEPIAVPSPAGTAVYAEPAPVVPVDRRVWLRSGIIAILGGYLTIGSISGGLVQQLAGFMGAGPEYTVLLVGQLVFAIGVTALGYFLVPGPLGRRILGKVVYALAIVILVVVVTLRITGGLGGFGGAWSGVSIGNPYFMVLLFGGLGWLIASGAKPLGYLALIFAFLMIPITYFLLVSGIPSAIAVMIQMVVVLIGAVLILLASWPRRPIGVVEEPALLAPTAYGTPETAPAAAPAPND
jgi:hypothetical protein